MATRYPKLLKDNKNLTKYLVFLSRGPAFALNANITKAQCTVTGFSPASLSFDACPTGHTVPGYHFPGHRFLQLERRHTALDHRDALTNLWLRNTSDHL